MASRHTLARRLQVAGALIVVVLTAVVWLLIVHGGGWPFGVRIGAFVLVALVTVGIVDRWFDRVVVRPLRALEALIVRVARGDLRANEAEFAAIGGGPIRAELSATSGPSAGCAG
jgi:hypothetical protein